ncbi:uncharacterized protein LOC121375708 isoform X2 [Gigantopelta aegis]|nr:uncharacterized protein LOC121375708 isoform X2 [Gigantopelta aegis]XP_041359234.1 uncharacterized protein LOC121375708 isoform X2 [Gigantopelta aegis]XP_041359235.1 uncharacterized protein LOC121375708 isoform X2 [Gigantopelta aegis]XP_041359236.1 uncharacterized protein LOC121375708 isoform X2 [Gigantopelta aegis]
MGNTSSRGRIISTEKTPQQPQGPPYPGPSAEYFFLNTEVSISAHIRLFVTSNTMITTDIDNYYPLLARKYEEGFRLLTFYRIPDVVRQKGISLSNPTVTSPFQGIFCCYPAVQSSEWWQLKVEKSTLVTQNIHKGLISFSMTQGTVSDTSHLYQTIVNNTQDGSRLVCLEMTGDLKGQGYRAARRGISPVMGVDLFFEVPTTPTMERYVYQCVPIPINVEYSISFGSSGIHVDCDWNGHLGGFLSQGWRLVEIFMDKSIQYQQHGFSSSGAHNSVWFFEKPASCIENPTPVYQGMVVDHWMKVVGGLGGTHAKTNWEPVIQQFGSQGWELACILETPEVERAGLISIKRKMLLFFQRHILPPLGSTPYVPGMHMPAGPDPNTYDLSRQEPPPPYAEASKH